MKTKKLFILFLLCLFLISCSQNEEYEMPEFDVYFCPKDDCKEALYNFILSAENELKCAFFELNLEKIIDLFEKRNEEIDIELLIDHRYEKYVNHLNFVQIINRSGLMHNKYCIADNKKILTGSTNPTDNCVNRNNNNLIIFNSTKLAKHYINNFEEIKNHSRPNIVNNKHPNLKVYFCPGDCIKFVSSYIREANTSIYFMAFAFTANEIAVDIILKHKNNLTVKGLFNRLNAGSQYSVIHMLKYQNIDVKIAQVERNLHHKVFIIDNSTVITGSFNPSANANNNNYENILVIKDKKIATKYAEEFFSIYEKS